MTTAGEASASLRTRQPSPPQHVTPEISVQARASADERQPETPADGFKNIESPSQMFASVSEARNEAKKAILRLLPHGVKYQTYIEEGFDGAVIKSLFTQLNLPSAPAPAISSEKPIIQEEHKESSKSASQPSQADSAAKKQEERKDRIARLLAEKKAKAAIPSSIAPVAPASKNEAASASAVATPAPRPPITRAEKDRLLQQKIEALRKAREAKTRATASTPTQISAPTLTSQAQASTTPQQPAAGVKSPARPSPATEAPSPAAASIPPQSTLSKSTTPQSSFSAAPSPGISSLTSTAHAPQLINQRKRPLAADFMDYSGSTVKRPSLANRAESSLVISVSDDEDDDDDVEMEVDSATEDSPVPSQQTLTLPRRGPSIRDYPPLTNMNSSRMVSSPVPGTTTPVGRNATVDLKAREREIAELRRKIQEAESRAKAKPKKDPATPQTPSTMDDTLLETVAKPLTHTVSAVLKTSEKSGPTSQSPDIPVITTTPKPSTPAPVFEWSTGKDRSLRTSSAPSSAKAAKIAEKAERLRRMQEEMLRLQTEIDEDMTDEDVTSDGEDVAQRVELEGSKNARESTGDNVGK